MINRFILQIIIKQDYVRSIKCKAETFTILTRNRLNTPKAVTYLSKQHSECITTDILNEECQRRLTHECRKVYEETEPHSQRSYPQRFIQFFSTVINAINYKYEKHSIFQLPKNAEHSIRIQVHLLSQL